METKYYTPSIEIWKNVVGFEDEYKVSSFGNVKRKDAVRKDNMLKQTSGIYRRVSLCKNNIKTNFSVHRLVAIAFIDNVDNKEFVNHIDGNKYNNILSNLEWATRLENAQHASKNGLVKNQYGENNSMSILTVEQVKDIKSKINEGVTTYKIHKYYYPNLHQQTIYRIKQGKIWKQIM